MGRMSNKNKLIKLKSEALSIKDLKEHIKDLPDDMLIGTTGHFGELYLCSKYDLTYEKGYIPSNGFWRDKHLEESVKVFSIRFADIGPDPD